MQVDVIDLEFSDRVAVDIDESKALVHRLLIVDTEPSAADMSAAAIAVLASDLLPDWHDDWVILEAED